MTDYNDGKWHGWNGGECPVDRLTMIEAVYVNAHGELRKDERSAGSHMWVATDMPRAETIAFRVVKPAPPKPRECWSYGAHILDTEAEAIAFRQAVADAHPGRGYGKGPITKWIEVLP